MKIIIAEKPSVAKSIAAVVGANNKKEGYMEGNGYAVTWAFGHLVGLAMPEHYGIEGFKRENLPILPKEFKLLPRQVKEGKEYKNDPGVMKQLKVIKELFNSGDEIIVATDAGREGELIFRYIFEYIGSSLPFRRLWISSLTDRAIRDGFQTLRPGSDYDNLYASAKARSTADWLVGINASQSLSVSAGYGVWSLGRVQTPTLAIICSRYLENKDFKPQTYFRLKLHTAKDAVAFPALSVDKFVTRTIAEEVTAQVKVAGAVNITCVERKEVKQEPPLLYDLTTLQKEANSKHGFSADKTLTIAQALYEAKKISYPRTGSRYISEDVLEEIPHLIATLRSHPLFGAYIDSRFDTTLNTRSVDDSKVTDHHALIITVSTIWLPGVCLKPSANVASKRTPPFRLTRAAYTFHAKAALRSSPVGGQYLTLRTSQTMRTIRQFYPPSLKAIACLFAIAKYRRSKPSPGRFIRKAHYLRRWRAQVRK